MSDPWHWNCPFCNCNATIQEENFTEFTSDIALDSVDAPKRLCSIAIACPNKKCRKLSLSVICFDTIWSRSEGKYIPVAGRIPKKWALFPESGAKPLPDYIPAAIVADYKEACLILDKSPKASATLSRRCLQGILRDFWSVKPGRLVDEIEQVKDKMDVLTWEAIDAVRKVGNIGAHMEKDINLIVEVEPKEAQLLVELIETVVRDWYVEREERRNRLTAIKTIAAAKTADKSAVKPPTTGTP